MGSADGLKAMTGKIPTISPALSTESLFPSYSNIKALTCDDIIFVT